MVIAANGSTESTTDPPPKTVEVVASSSPGTVSAISAACVVPNDRANALNVNKYFFIFLFFLLLLLLPLQR
jgi:hypothetical protein